VSAEPGQAARPRLLLTGSDGYIGTRLAPYLMQHGYEVIGLDTGYYRDGILYHDAGTMAARPYTRVLDLRRAQAADFRGIDAVVHLGELSNDPLGENRPEITHQINHEGSVHLATLARQAGVRRFVYTSSCSVYGLGSGEFLDEHSPVNPQTAYARCKTLVERDLQPMASNTFSVTFLRNATAFGPSPHMRFDIVINDLCALAWTTRRIAMTSDGSPWRPVVHIEDICEAIRCTLAAPPETVNAEIFNVGRNSENYRIRELAAQVAEVFEGCEVSAGPASRDNRSYRVCFDKISARLPGFVCRWSARAGIEELLALFRRIDFSQEQYQFRAFTRLKQLRHLLRTQQLDQDLYWR
jgi:nucleoside-diphosphate-sugar epimerase